MPSIRLLVAFCLLAVAAHSEPPKFPAVGIWMTSLPRIAGHEMNFAILAVTAVRRDDDGYNITYTQVAKSARKEPFTLEAVSVCRIDRFQLSAVSIKDGRISHAGQTADFRVDGNTVIMAGRLGGIAFETATAFQALSRREALSVWCRAINIRPLDVITWENDPDFRFAANASKEDAQKEALPRDGIWIEVVPNVSSASITNVVVLTPSDEAGQATLVEARIDHDRPNGTAVIHTKKPVKVTVSNGEIFEKTDHRTIPHFRVKGSSLARVNPRFQSEKTLDYNFWRLGAKDALIEPWAFAIDTPPLEYNAFHRDRR